MPCYMRPQRNCSPSPPLQLGATVLTGSVISVPARKAVRSTNILNISSLATRHLQAPRVSHAE